MHGRRRLGSWGKARRGRGFGGEKGKGPASSASARVRAWCTHGVAMTVRKLGQGNGGVHKQASGEFGSAEGRRLAQAEHVRDAPCACKADGGKWLRCPMGKGEGQAEQMLRVAGRILPSKARPELGKVKAK